MKATTELRGTALIIKLSGRVTVGPALMTMREATGEIQGSDARLIAIDIRAVSFIDSAGLGELVACHRAADRLGARFALCGARGKVADMLELTRLGEILPLYPSVEDALS